MSNFSTVTAQLGVKLDVVANLDWYRTADELRKELKAVQALQRRYYQLTKNQPSKDGLTAYYQNRQRYLMYNGIIHDLKEALEAVLKRKLAFDVGRFWSELDQW